MPEPTREITAERDALRAEVERAEDESAKLRRQIIDERVQATRTSQELFAKWRGECDQARAERDKERESRIAWALEADRLQQIADRAALPEDWQAQLAGIVWWHQDTVSSDALERLERRLTKLISKWQAPSVSDQTPATPDDSHGVRRLIVHPAAWDGLVRFLDVRGIEVTPYPDEDGIPTFGMGIKEFPAPSSVQGDTTPREECATAGGVCIELHDHSAPSEGDHHA